MSPRPFESRPSSLQQVTSAPNAPTDDPTEPRPSPDAARRARRAHLQSATQKTIVFELRGEFIGLDSLLKATGIADSGGAGKAMVTSGGVTVDGNQELRKTCKIRAGQVVSIGETQIKVRACKV